jgi:integrase/recombinase XerD
MIKLLSGKPLDVVHTHRCSPHTTRHYFAQAQLRNGNNVYNVSRLLGHENINITKRYLQSLQDDKIIEMSIRASPLTNLK